MWISGYSNYAPGSLEFFAISIGSSGNSPDKVSQTVTVYGGDHLTLWGDLYGWAEVMGVPNPGLPGGNFGYAQFKFDASNTDHLYINVDTPGASLISDIGWDYSSPSFSPTPEPSSLLMLGSGSGEIFADL